MDLAYLDAGSGSQLAMAIVAGFAGAMVAIRVWWRRITSKFRALTRRTSKQGRQEQSTDSKTPAGNEGASGSQQRGAAGADAATGTVTQQDG